MKKSLFWLFAFLPPAITFLFYLPVAGNDFVNWDDKAMIIDNPHLRSLDFGLVQWSFSTFRPNWIPLTWISLAVNFWMGGLQPPGYHLTNALIHAGNTFLVFWVCFHLLKLAGKDKGGLEATGGETFEIAPAFLTALLFGLHPIHVESVAWAAERKDVLYAFFYLLSLALYLNYANGSKKKPVKLVACWLSFLLSLFSKPMAVTLPLILFLFDYWPLKRFQGNSVKKVFLEKIPFLALSALFGLITLNSQANVVAQVKGPMEAYLWMNPFRSLFYYLLKMVLPVDLVPFYPLSATITQGYVLSSTLAVLLTVVVTGFCFIKRVKHPGLWTAWLFYWVSLAPVLGFIQVGSQAMADRYTYLPSAAPFFLISVGIASLTAERWIPFGFFCLGLTGLLGWGTLNQIGTWHDSETLWKNVIRVYPGQSPIPYTNLGIYYLKAGRTNDGLEELNRALAIPVPYPQTNNAIGAVLLNQGRTDDAIRQFQTAIALDPQYVAAHANLALAYGKKGQGDAAFAEREILKKLAAQ